MKVSAQALAMGTFAPILRSLPNVLDEDGRPREQAGSSGA